VRGARGLAQDRACTGGCDSSQQGSISKGFKVIATAFIGNVKWARRKTGAPPLQRTPVDADIQVSVELSSEA